MRRRPGLHTLRVFLAVSALTYGLPAAARQKAGVTLSYAVAHLPGGDGGRE